VGGRGDSVIGVRFGSTFSGIGGLDLGLERAGIEHVFLCESDEWRRGVLAERFPGVPIYDDVRAVGVRRDGPREVVVGGTAAGGRARGKGAAHAGRAVRVKPEEGGTADGRGTEPDGAGRLHAGTVSTDLLLDGLAGGFPCQDLSVAGRRAGLEGGERSSLFFEFARIADDLVRPGGYVLIENVPGLLSSQSGRDFAIVLATLAELGFHDCAWRVLDSRYFGVPQRRRRVFILCSTCSRTTLRRDTS
jgi:site-specific DNA-cytosine methylase